MRIQQFFHRLALIVWLVGMLTIPAQAQMPPAHQVWLPLVLQHRMVDLGALGADSATAYAINHQGQVVGVNVGDPYQTVAVVWTPGVGIQRIGPPRGDSAAFAINRLGHVVGTMEEQQQAFLWTPEGGLRGLGSLGGNSALAYAINDQDQVVGVSTNSRYHDRAFLWEPGGGMRDLGTLGGAMSRATAINNHGQVVGVSELANEDRRAFLWTVEGGMQDLGTPAGDWSAAIDINDRGEVLGATFDPQTWRRTIFIWSAETGMIDLATRGCQLSRVSAFNERGQVIGTREVRADIEEAALCNPNGTMLDLGALGAYGSMAWDINAAGTVVGESTMAAATFQRRATQWGS